MVSGDLLRIGKLPFCVEALPVQHVLVAWFRGEMGEPALVTLREAHDVLVTAPEPRLALELHQVRGAGPHSAATFARTLREAHRVGKEIYLVRCPDWFYRQLAAEGVGGTVRHTGSLVAATDGQLDAEHATWTLSLRSAPEHLRRLRGIISIVGDGRGIPDDELQQVKTAVGEACTNAITHGSPNGRRNNIQVSFHLSPESLIVDVADEGPGFDPDAVPEPVAEALMEHGYGIYMMRQLMDRLEYFRDGTGTVVRLTKMLPAAGG